MTSSEPVRARVVIVQDGCVALIRRVREGRTYYLFPGGGVEESETPEQAAVREAREELGVAVELAELLHEEVFRETRFLYFGARIAGGEFGTGEWPNHADPESLARSGSYEPIWLRLSGLANHDVRPRELAEALIDQRDKP